MTIKESIQKIVESKIGGNASHLCTVESVNGSTCNVKTLDTEIELHSVRLQTAASNGVLLKPKVGSIVVVTPITDFEFVVVMFSDIDEITLLDGSFGGLVMVGNLVSKINALENKVNSIVTWGLTVSPPFPSSTLITPTIRADIENTLITHGQV